VYCWCNGPATLPRGLRPVLEFGLSKPNSKSRRADSNRWLAHYECYIRRCRGLHGVCKSRISQGFSLLCLALRCTGLRSRWCQYCPRSGRPRSTASSTRNLRSLEYAFMAHVLARTTQFTNRSSQESRPKHDGNEPNAHHPDHHALRLHRRRMRGETAAG
jgi:hypothetical protein